MIKRAALAVIALMTWPGCVYSLHVTNGHVRNLDAAHVVVGETTARDVLQRFGPPPPQEAIAYEHSASAYELDASPGVYSYVTRESRCVSVLFARFGPGATLPPKPPYGICDHNAAYALVVEFDAHGLVERVSTGRSEGRWRPWQSVQRDVNVKTSAVPGASLR